MIAVPPLDYAALDKHAFRTRLLDAIAVFDEVDSVLQSRAVEFLISGCDVEVLLDVRDALRRPDRPQFFTLNDQVLTPVNARRGAKLLELFRQKITPVGYYQRLGQFCSQHPQLQHAYALPDAELPQWFNDLMRMATTLCPWHDFSIPEHERSCDCGAMLASLNSQDTCRFLRLLMLSRQDQPRMLTVAMGKLSGLKAFVEAKLDPLLAIARPDPSLHEPLLVLLNHFRMPLSHQQLAEVIDYGLALSRSHRSDFQSLLERHRADAKTWLLQRLNQGTPTQRMRAAQWLDKIYGKSIAGALGDALAHEKDNQVRAFIQPLYEVYREAEDYERVLEQQLALPEVAIPNLPIPLAAQFVLQFKSFINKVIARSHDAYPEALQVHALSQHPPSIAESLRGIPPTADELQTLFAFMEGRSTTKPGCNTWLWEVLRDTRALADHCDLRRLHWVHCVRLLEAMGSLQEQSSALVVHHGQLLFEHRRVQDQPYGLRELDAAAEQLYGRPHLMSRGYLMHAVCGADSAGGAFTDHDIWPAFVKQVKLLEEAIAGVALDEFDRDVLRRRKTALAIAGMLPMLPRQLADAAWSLALGDAGTLRPLARPLLARQQDRFEKACAALSSRSSGARMGAAELLQEIGNDKAIDPLKKALKKEKQRPVQGVLLAALEKLGADVDEFIGRDTLLQCAIEGVQRPLRSMMWFPMDKLPIVRWAADDQPLEPIILRWWLTQCIFFKSITCSPVMRRALELCRRDDTLKLAHFILEQWISFDTAEPTRAELEQHYREDARAIPKLLALASQTGLAVDQLIARMVTDELRDIRRRQSAYTERGMLAIVAAFGDEKCVEMIEHYLKNFQRNRSRQSKSLREVMAHIVQA